LAGNLGIFKEGIPNLRIIYGKTGKSEKLMGGPLLPL
jgi:hypothetical protein